MSATPQKEPNLFYKDKSKDELIKKLQERLCWAEYELEKLYQSLKPQSNIKGDKK